MSVAILLSLLSKSPCSLQAASDHVHFDGYGQSNAEEIVSGLKKLGYSSAALTVSGLELCGSSSVGPFIAHLRQGHFVVAMVTKNLRVIVMDGSGVKSLGREQFCQIWSGAIIVAKQSQADLFAALAAIGAM